MNSAIILDGQLKSALAAVRSLGQKGIVVSVGGERDTGMALHSRYARSRCIYPSPYTNEASFIDRVEEEAVRLGGKPVVYAFSDATFLALYAARERLKEHVRLIFPEQESIDLALDKAATYSLARVIGIPTITTHMPVSKAEVARLGETLAYPAVVKTRRSVTKKEGKRMFGSATFVHSQSELQHTYDDLAEKLGEAPLIQKFVRGEEYGVEMLAKKGEIFARVTHHRIRSLSPTGGASVVKETLGASALRSQIEAYAERLVEKLSWSGPIMVEFKVDSDTRTPYLMEINGRFWGSLPLSIAAGVDMPFLYYEYAQSGKTPTDIITGKEGVITRHLCGDVRHLLRVFFSHDRMRSLLYPTRGKALHDFVSFERKIKPDVWSWRDPKPAFWELVDIFSKLWYTGR